MKTYIKKLNETKSISEIFLIFKDEKDVAFLDSSLRNNLGRFSIIGVNPYWEIKGEKKDFLCEMKDFLDKNKEGNNTELPIISGGIGYMSYDEGENEIPENKIIFYDNFIIEDHNTNEIYITGAGKTGNPENTVGNIIKKIIKSEKKIILDRENQYEKIHSLCTEDNYKNAVKNIVEDIKNGDVYVVNMTDRIIVETEKDPYSIYDSMRTINPAPFGGYLNYGEYKIISSSPEEFINIKEGIIRTRPIKGTRKKTDSEIQNIRSIKELRESEKDKSELLMVVDLERNDLNRICVPGTVKVPELFKIEEYSTVYHLVCEVCGKLRDDVKFNHIIDAVFPGGSITGAPKESAMNMIKKYEKGKRGIYTGIMGYVGFDGNMGFNILIRSALWKRGVMYYGTGGGITCESEPEFEYEEMVLKSRSFLKSVESKEKKMLKDEGYDFGLGVFETICIHEKTPLFLQYHMERLKEGIKKIGLNEDLIKGRINEFIIKKYIYENNITDCSLKIIVSEKNIIFEHRENPYNKEKYLKGFDLVTSEVLRNESSLFCYIKSLNYGDNIIEKRKAIINGYDEPVFLNTKGNYTEGSTTNIFFVKDGKIYTSSIDQGLLNGTIRNYLMENYEIIEKEIPHKTIKEYDEIFLTNSLMGIMRVNSVDQYIFKDHLITDKIFNDYIKTFFS